MTRHEKKKYYQSLAKKYDRVSEDLSYYLKYNLITFINTDLDILLPKDKLILYRQSKMTALKNGFLRSYKEIDENPNLTKEDKVRIYKKMVVTYNEKTEYIRDKIDEIYERIETKDYTFEDKLKEVRKIKHYK